MFIRCCPDCAGDIIYRWPSQVKLAEERNSVCKSCRTRRANKSNKRNAAKEGNPAWKGYKGVGYKWFSKYFERGGRKKTGSITIEDAYSQLEKQNFRCALTDQYLPWSEDSGMSIDRVDSSIGYELGNIQLVHKDVNLMKNHFDQDYFILVCKQIAEKYK